MANELAEKAKEAFIDDDFDDAVDLYSKAIDLDRIRIVPNTSLIVAYIKLESVTGIFFLL